MKLIANNKKANFEYFIISTYEAGVVLAGSEVKSIRLGHCSLNDSFISFSKGEAYIKNMHISTYKDASFDKLDEKRIRKQLLNRHELDKLISKVKEKSFTCIPLKVYLKDQFVKIEIALAKGKHLYDKKETLAKKDIERDTQRQLKYYR